MTETLKKLHEIGIDEIHAKTHISIHSLKAILEERFADISPIQYTGFLTLIEADMYLNMDELRDSYQAYREDTGQVEDNRELFVNTPKDEKNYKPLIISLISVALIVIFISSMSTDKKIDDTLDSQAQNSAIEDAAKHLLPSKDDKTAPKDIQKEHKNVVAFNASQAQADESKSNNTHPFVLYPKEALWIGVINIDTDEQRDTITSAPYVLDENANLLISLGHGMVKVDLNGDVQNISDTGRVRFLYKNGNIERISLDKFKELNKGKSW